MRWKVFLDKIQNYISYVGFHVFTVQWDEPNEISFSFFLLLLAVSIFAWYLSLCLHPDMSNASWHELTESLQISYEKDNDKILDSIESRSCLIIDDEWLDPVFMYLI